jgi:ComF family protein
MVKDLIILFKYGRCSVLAGGMAAFIDLALGSDAALWDGVEAIVPVPLDRRRKRDRGFNQSLLLARELGVRRGLPVLDRRLMKVRPAPPQVSLEAAERERNVRGAYDVRKREEIRGRTLLVLDDVYTTGSTLRECSAVLKRAGAAEVRAVTIAQA